MNEAPQLPTIKVGNFNFNFYIVLPQQSYRNRPIDLSRFFLISN